MWQSGEISPNLVPLFSTPFSLPQNHLFCQTNDELEGEIIASVETADREAPHHAWHGDDELLLYVIHGMLHVIGLLDKKEEDIQKMRAAEKHYLSMFAL